MNDFDAALAAVRAAFAEPIIYDGDGLAAATIQVVWSDVAADPFQGPGNTARVVSCEVSQADLPQRPSKAGRITRAGRAWKVNEVTPRDDVGAWVLTLERA